MAKVKFGQGVADIRGRLGGSVFSRNSSGAYIREKVSPVNPQSEKQLARRSMLSLISKAWAAVDANIRQGWADLARAYPRTDVFGNPVPLTGIAQFQSTNLVKMSIGQQIQVDVPADLVVSEVLLDTVTIDAATRKLQITLEGADPRPAAHVLYARMTRSHSAGKAFVANLFRFVDHATPPAAPTDLIEMDISDDFGPVGSSLTFSALVHYVNSANGALSRGVLRTFTIA
jgi:hypothetical protein